MVAITGCWQRENNVALGDREQILHRGIGPEIPDLDPHLATSSSEYNVLIALLEGLVTEDPVDLHPVPGVAESWDASSDGLTYTFHLRGNARWSNGDPVTAQDFAASFRRMLTPSLAADYAWMLYVLQNAEAFNRGKLADFGKVGIEAVNTRTLKLTLEHPTPQFLSMLTHTAFMPVHLPTVEKYGPTDRRGNAWTRPGRFVGNGPFVLKTWQIGQRIVVSKSPTYWDAGAVRLKEIDFYPIESRDVEERAFRAGQLHLTESLAPSKIDAYRRNDPQMLRIDPYLGTEFYRINVNRPFLNDRRVRRALALSVDRQKIVENVLRGGQLPANEFTPPQTAGYTAPALLSYDPNAARALLVAAGYPNGRGAPPIELLLNPSESHRAVAEAVQEMWRRELGLEVRLLNQEYKVMVASRRTGDFQIMRSVWIGDYVDPLSFLAIFGTNNGNNYTGWSNRSYDQAVFESERVTDPASRNDLFKKAESLLLEEVPIIPIYHYTHVFLIRPSVKNWHPNLLDHHPYKAVYLEK
ncbi:peptide ABC transporter substrate-binding protein [Opitutaceae bacterium EW11]|nr:peptide ABC transporter substrate-binding protein [Opitutaceae bacterium EW11]